jgi:hypothetical protein
MTITTRAFFTVLSMITVAVGTACDCKPTPSVEESMRSSQLVIGGTVIEARYGKQLEQSPGYLDSLSQRLGQVQFGPVRSNEYTILVTEAFKGASIGDTVILRTALDPVTDCGLRLSIGEKYIVYAKAVSRGDTYYDQRRSITFTTSACSRTRLSSRAELRAINKATDQ